MQTLISPKALPEAQATSLAPLFTRLLELRSEKHLTLLAANCQEAIVSLPEEDRPETYEGLLDVARYCIDEEPGWTDQDKAALLHGHPRVGAHAKDAVNNANIKVDVDDADLVPLNFVYERRYPGLRYVTHATNKSRNSIVEEMKRTLGKDVANLTPPDGADPEKPSTSALHWSEEMIKPIHMTDETWRIELLRGLDALFEIAMHRASKITPEEYTAPDRTTPFIDENEAFDEPFLTFDRFKSLVKLSPLLTTFFEFDLPSSFYLVPPPPPQETPREALATLAAVAITGGGGGDATKKRVKGLLGGLWGEVADRAGKVTGRETRSGPRPAFGREETLRGEEMRAKGTKTSNMTPATSTDDILDAEETLKKATQRLTDTDRGHFVIDEPSAAGDAEPEDEETAEDVELGLGMERLDIDGSGVADGEGGAHETAKQKEKEIAKDLRTATVAQ